MISVIAKGWDNDKPLKKKNGFTTTRGGLYLFRDFRWTSAGDDKTSRVVILFYSLDEED